MLNNSEEEIPLDNFYAKVKPNNFRRFLSRFSFGLSTGYGSTFLRHSLNGFGVNQRVGATPTIYSLNGANTVYYSNWINDVTIASNNIGGQEIIDPNNKLGFKGKATNIPIKLTVHYEFMEKFRIGGGVSYEMMSIGTLQPTSYMDKIESIKPSRSFGIMSKYFGLIGFSFYRIRDYRFTGDLQVGSYKPGNNFNKSLILAGYFFNLGVTFEKEFSEIIKVFIRPSFESKKYDISIPNTTLKIDHSLNAFYINFGISYSIPSLRKCFISNCRTQHNHPHGNREYRSRVHPIYMMQNPPYGKNPPFYSDPKIKKRSPRLKIKSK